MKLVIICAAFVISLSASAVPDSLKSSDTGDNDRLRWTIAGESAGFVGGFGLLYYVWYRDYPGTSFHLFNDNPEWLQVDKAGHVWSGYHISEASASIMQWAGVEKRKAQWIGVGQSALFLTTMEVLDGFASDWGFSWGDIAANTIGQGMYIGQSYLWDEQRIRIKYMTQLTGYAQYRPELLGSDPLQRLIKDYNGHSYWLSVNPSAFVDADWIPKWLDVSFGYGGRGMIAGRPEDNGVYAGLEEFERYREFLFSIDLNVEGLNIKQKWLRNLLKPFKAIKVPFPALAISSKGVYGYWIR